MEGRYDDAIKTAHKLHDHAAPHVDHMQMMEIFTLAPELVMERFNKSDDILKRVGLMSGATSKAVPPARRYSK